MQLGIDPGRDLKIGTDEDLRKLVHLESAPPDRCSTVLVWFPTLVFVSTFKP
jgi:hypothetical protein